MNDEEAVRRCQDGDREAFRHLVERYKDVLYGTACLMTGNAYVAEEHVQESFLLAWRGVGGFRVGLPVKPWLVRILVNTITSQRRRGSVPTTALEEATHSEVAGNPADLAERVANQLVVCLPNGFTIRQRSTWPPGLTLTSILSLWERIEVRVRPGFAGRTSSYQHCNAIYETLD